MAARRRALKAPRGPIPEIAKGLTRQQVGWYLQLAPATVHHLEKTGQLTPFRDELGVARFRCADVRKLAAEREAQIAEATPPAEPTPTRQILVAGPDLEALEHALGPMASSAQLLGAVVRLRERLRDARRRDP